MPTYLRTLYGLVPPSLGTGAIETLIVSEGPSQSGPWVQIGEAEVKDEEPLDITVEGIEDPAYYQVLWETKGGEQTEGPVFFLGGATIEWTPTLEQVAALVWARTKAAGGKEAGTFNETTRPTGRVATSIIEQSVQMVSGSLTASPCSGNLRESARAHAAAYAAMLIEASFFPEQTESSGSSFQARLKLWERSIDRLAETIRVNCGGGEGEEGEELESAALPAGGYDDGLLLYGRDYPLEW